MKIKDLWGFIGDDVLVIITRPDGEIIGNIWKDDVDNPSLLEREVAKISLLEKRVLQVGVK